MTDFAEQHRYSGPEVELFASRHTDVARGARNIQRAMFGQYGDSVLPQAPVSLAQERPSGVVAAPAPHPAVVALVQGEAAGIEQIRQVVEEAHGFPEAA